MSVARLEVLDVVLIRGINILAQQGNSIVGVLQLTIGPSEGRVPCLAWQAQRGLRPRSYFPSWSACCPFLEKSMDSPRMRAASCGA